MTKKLIRTVLSAAAALALTITAAASVFAESGGEKETRCKESCSC